METVEDTQRVKVKKVNQKRKIQFIVNVTNIYKHDGTEINIKKKHKHLKTDPDNKKKYKKCKHELTYTKLPNQSYIKLHDQSYTKFPEQSYNLSDKCHTKLPDPDERHTKLLDQSHHEEFKGTSKQESRNLKCKQKRSTNKRIPTKHTQFCEQSHTNLPGQSHSKHCKVPLTKVRRNHLCKEKGNTRTVQSSSKKVRGKRINLQSSDRPVPQCLRDTCRPSIASKQNLCKLRKIRKRLKKIRAEEAKHKKILDLSPISSSSLNTEDLLSLDEVSSGSFSSDEEYAGSKLDTLIKRTKDRDKMKRSRLEKKGSFTPKPCTSKEPEPAAADITICIEDSDRSRCGKSESDHSIHSQATVILDPRDPPSQPESEPFESLSQEADKVYSTTKNSKESEPFETVTHLKEEPDKDYSPTKNSKVNYSPVNENNVYSSTKDSQESGPFEILTHLKEEPDKDNSPTKNSKVNYSAVNENKVYSSTKDSQESGPFETLTHLKEEPDKDYSPTKSSQVNYSPVNENILNSLSVKDETMVDSSFDEKNYSPSSPVKSDISLSPYYRRSIPVIEGSYCPTSTVSPSSPVKSDISLSPYYRRPIPVIEGSYCPTSTVNTNFACTLYQSLTSDNISENQANMSYYFPNVQTSDITQDRITAIPTHEVPLFNSVHFQDYTNIWPKILQESQCNFTPFNAIPYPYYYNTSDNIYQETSGNYSHESFGNSHEVSEDICHESSENIFYGNSKNNWHIPESSDVKPEPENENVEHVEIEKVDEVSMNKNVDESQMKLDGNYNYVMEANYYINNNVYYQGYRHNPHS